MEFSTDYAQYASQIVERLLSGDGEKLYQELEKDIVIYDLELDVSSFSNELDFVEDAKLRIPAVRIAGDEGYIPVSFALIFYPTELAMKYPFKRSRELWRGHPYYYEYVYHLLRQYEKEEPIGPFTTISPGEARNAFTRRAVNFLATRITAVRNFRKGETRAREKWGMFATLNLLQTAGGAQVTTPGCHFTVSTNSIGLRVFWSGAYYLSPNFFSQPTTPVTSVLQAGTYVFGVDGGAYGNIIQWDTNAVVSLPGNPTVHLNY